MKLVTVLPDIHWQISKMLKNNARTIGKRFRVFKSLQRKVLEARSVSCETVVLILTISQTAVLEINFFQKNLNSY